MEGGDVVQETISNSEHQIEKANLFFMNLIECFKNISNNETKDKNNAVLYRYRTVCVFWCIVYILASSIN